MVLGLSTFGWIQTLLGLLALVAGLVVVIGLFGQRSLDGWTAVFLASAAATSATGFGFGFERFAVSHWVGVVALVVLGAAILARYVFHLAGAWRWVYAVGMVVSLYFLVLVAVAQAFRKVPGLREVSQWEVYAQIAVLLAFILIGCAAASVFRSRPVAA